MHRHWSSRWPVFRMQCICPAAAAIMELGTRSQACPSTRAAPWPEMQNMTSMASSWQWSSTWSPGAHSVMWMEKSMGQSAVSGVI